MASPGPHIRPLGRRHGGFLPTQHDRRKTPAPLAGLAGALRDELARIQGDLFTAALARREQNTCRLDSWDDFVSLYEGAGGFAWCHWCEDDNCELQIQEETRATIRNIPLAREEEAGSCVRCGRPSPGRVLFAQAY